MNAVRVVHDDVEEADPTSADLLHVVIGSLEKHAWMISAETQLNSLSALESATWSAS